MKMKEEDIRPTLLIGLQVALLDMITTNIRGITCGISNKTIMLKFIYDGPYSEEDRDRCEIIASEVLANFPDPFTINNNLLVVEPPLSINKELLSNWVYSRWESISD